MIYFFNWFKNVGYDTGLILEPWYAYTLFFKNVQNRKMSLLKNGT